MSKPGRRLFCTGTSFERAVILSVLIATPFIIWLLRTENPYWVLVIIAFVYFSTTVFLFIARCGLMGPDLQAQDWVLQDRGLVSKGIQYGWHEIIELSVNTQNVATIVINRGRSVDEVTFGPLESKSVSLLLGRWQSRCAR